MQRDKTIDVAKGIGIFLVVYGHMNYQQPMQMIIYSFHMPLFFLISGLLFKREKYSAFKNFLKRRFKTLILPYLFFAFTSLLYCLILRFLDDGFTSELLSNGVTDLIQIFIAQSSHTYVINGPLWFVPCLFAVECMFFFLSGIKSVCSRRLLILCIVFIGWFTESKYCPIDFSLLPWNFSSACFSLGFYALGHYWGSFILSVLKSSIYRMKLMYKCIYVLILSSALVMLAYWNHLEGTISIGSRCLNNGFMLYATGILGTVICLIISDMFKNSTLLEFWGRNSFYIMATHRIFQSILFVLSEVILGTSLEQSPRHFIPSMIVIAIVMIMCSIFSKYYNKFMNKGKSPSWCT